ncbi:MAG: hypothetical protein HY288_12100 [Planctomycetia bacterium]|nr:hypothetical protein [Planctomycetia bacterium]
MKLARVKTIWTATLDEVLQRGFHGVATVELNIQDGTIQRICRSIERIEK